MALNNTVRVTLDTPGPSFLKSLDPSLLPQAAGNNWRDPAFRASHHKSQALSAEFLRGKGRTALPQGKPREEMPDVMTKSAFDLLDTHPAYRSRDPSVDEAPINATLDDKCFRFFAFFQEPIHESPTEKLRTRRVAIQYFPDDSTISISEPRVVNSGLPGGMFLRRGKVPASVRQLEKLPNDAFVNINHIQVGYWVAIHGRMFFVYDCEPATRIELEALGIDVPPSEDPPEDDLIRSATNRHALFSGTGTGGSPFGIRSQDHEFERAARGRRFVEDSGKILRFYGRWDDREAVGGIMHDLELRFFVEDDTVSIKENQSTGESVGAVFLSRRRLPRDGSHAKAAELTFAARKNGVREPFINRQHAYYEAQDLYIGAVVNVFGRDMLLTDCDLYTREYYANNLRADPGEPCELQAPKDMNRISKVGRRDTRNDVLPPHTGFGDPEDAAVSCKGLVLVPPKKKAPLSEDEETLRYELRFDNPLRAEERMRRFILNYFVEDGTILVQECAVPNTGFTGGRFLRRQRIPLNPDITDPADKPVYMSPRDFTIDAKITINKFNFVVTRVDDHTVNYLASKDQQSTARASGVTAEEDPVAPERLNFVLKTLQEHLTVRFYNLTEAFRAFDQDKDGKITIGDMKRALAEHNITTRPNEALAVLSALDRAGAGCVSYEDWFACFGVKHRLQADVAGALKARSSRSDAAAELQRYAESAAEKLRLQQRDAVLRRLRDKLDSRCLNCFEMFRMVSCQPRAFKGRRTDMGSITNIEKDTLITPVQLRRCSQETLGLMYNDAEMRVLIEFFFPTLPLAEHGRRADVIKEPSVDLKDFQAKFNEMVRIGTLEKTK